MSTEITQATPEVSAKDLVKEFMVAFEHDPTPELCRTLIREETKEVAEAVANLLKEFCDLVYVMEQAEIQGVLLDSVEKETIANIATLFNIYGRVFADGQFKEAFQRVHNSNMSKLVGGKPLRREDGKVLKGPNYKAPDLMDLV